MTELRPVRRPKIDLIESGGPSGRLRLITGYYAWSAGIVTVWLTVSTAVGVLSGLSAFVQVLIERPAPAAFAVLVCASTVQTYRLLRDRRRSGVIAAAIPVVLSVANHFLRNAPVGWLNLLVSVVGLILLATVWNELE